ncbi:MAG: hypothetical protein RSC64_01015 [Hydrogenoanaerobacterium sp.]
MTDFEQENNDNLEFIRAKFDSISENIAVPQSVNASCLAQKLNAVPPQLTVTKTPVKWRRFAGVAAALAVIIGAAAYVNMGTLTAKNAGAVPISANDAVGAVAAFDEASAPKEAQQADAKQEKARIAPENEAAPAPANADAVPNMMYAIEPEGGEGELCQFDFLQNFGDELVAAAFADGKVLKAYISETEGTFIINITKAGEESIRKKIKELAEEKGISSDWYKIVVTDS